VKAFVAPLDTTKNEVREVDERVILLSQFFHPEAAAVPQLLTELAVELRQLGVDLLVYTAQPTYHRRERLGKKDEYRGVRIRRLFSTQLRKDVSWGRLLDGVTFSASAALRLLLGQRRGVVVTTTSPPFLPWVACLAYAIRHRRYVVLVHDLYPDVAIKLGYLREAGVVTRVWRHLNRMAFRRAAAIIVLGNSMREEVEKYGGIRHLPIHIIHSWADGAHIMPLAKSENRFAREHGLSGKVVVLYSGNLGLAHDLETVVEAAGCLRTFSELVVLFIGEGGKKAKLMSLVEQRGLGNVRFLPHVPYADLPYSLTAGDIGVVTLEKGVEGLCEPSKLYGYLAAGLAILGIVGERSEVAEIIQRHECGYRVEQGDIEGAIKALTRWLENPAELQRMKANARRCFEEFYDKERAINSYLKILKAV
jgi:colanic acid biosynthesis glycosyl transferase WcaI